MHFGTFIEMSLRGNVQVWLGCTKTRSPGIGMVLHWGRPDVHIFYTDPSLRSTGTWIYLCFSLFWWHSNVIIYF